MGFVYLLECSNDDHTVYKIGYTKSTIQNRIRNLQTGNSYEIKELCRYETEFDQKLERIIHRCYNHRKIKNEWFNLEINDITNFISNCERVEKNLNELKDNHFFNK